MRFWIQLAPAPAPTHPSVRAAFNPVIIAQATAVGVAIEEGRGIIIQNCCVRHIG